MASRGQGLDRLTRRWRERHDARRGPNRPQATGGREALARRAFPYREQTPVEYADAHAADMLGFTYDEESYADPELDAWLVELGGILRERRAKPSGAKPRGAEPSGAEPSGAEPDG
ncbi:MAG TPA: hypothetical protein VEW45_08690 [Candidatus Dormibacteraeota bacterium]|nr:hypothetical protein [Candidatus Dormibacteraeota bacterium]